MAKAYWVVCYRSISNPVARDEYTKLAVPAVLAGTTTRRSRAPSWPGGAQPRASKSPIACIGSAITGQNPDQGGSTQDALILVLALPMLIVRGVPAQ